jgi:hypothetical protein
MNRLKEFLDQPEQPDPTNDFYEVYGGYAPFIVTRQTAMELERRLNELPPPMWVVFHDVMGSRHRISAQRIYRISESTAAQRAASREFDRARKEEQRDGGMPWEDNDD